jgi:predicted transcriptional regulator YdeE
MTTTSVSVPANALVAKDTAPFAALGFTTRTTLPRLSDWNHVVGELFGEADRLGLTVTGPIQYVYTGVNGDETNEFQLDIVLPIAAPGALPDTFEYRQIPGFSCMSYTYVGSWEHLPEVYDLLFPQLYAGGQKNDGHVREVYINHDGENPDACVSEIQIGLA